MPDLEISQSDDSVILTVKVVPASSRTKIAGTLGKVLKVKIASPPEKGKANAELSAFFAKLLKIRKKDVNIASGTNSTIKQLKIDGVSLQYVEETIADILNQAG
jgi:uncharacterized protein (TIGR00251 family)